MADFKRHRPPYLHLEFLDSMTELEIPRPLYVHRHTSSACLPERQATKWSHEILGPQSKCERASALPSPPPHTSHKTSSSLDDNMPLVAAHTAPRRKIRPLPPIPSSPRPRPLPEPPLSEPPYSAPPVLPVPSIPPALHTSSRGQYLIPPPRAESLPTCRRQKFFIVCNPDPDPEPVHVHVQPSPPPQQPAPPQQQMKLHLTIPNSTELGRSLSIKLSPLSTCTASPVVFTDPDQSPLSASDRSIRDSGDIEGIISDRLLYGDATVVDDGNDHELTKIGDFEHAIYIETPIQLHGIPWNREGRDRDDDEDDANSNTADDEEERWEFADGMMVHVGRRSRLLSKKWIREQGKKRWTEDDFGGIIQALRML